jgi:hypothetical protein
MYKRGRQRHEPWLLIKRGGLNGRDLLLAQALANDIEPCRKWRVAKGARTCCIHRSSGQSSRERLLRILELALRPGQRGGERADVMAGALHDHLSQPGRQS